MLSEDIFVDTGAWVALADKDDRHHGKAASVFPSILKTRRKLLTSNLIIAETYVLLQNELGKKAALNFLERIKASPRILRIYSSEDIETEAEGLLGKYVDQDFSYTDAVSFVIMKKQKTKTSFSFNKHFMTAGFTMIP